MTSSIEIAHPGVISLNSAYRLDEAKRRLGMSEHAMRQARRRGLKVRYVGRRGYLLGRDWLAFLETQSKETAQFSACDT